MTAADYDAAYASLAERYNSLPTECNATFCPQSDWSGCILRAAGHDFMDFDGTGGADGCLDLQDVDNNGLHECLYMGEFGVSVLQAYQEHCTRVSLADYLVIAGETVMHLARQHVLQADPNRAPLDFKSSFRFGRTTAMTCPWAVGRLPDAERSCTAVQETFLDRMGLSWAQAAALMGVHTLGRAQIKHSGYDGFWSDAQNSRLFNNNYYFSILNKGWRPEAVAGNVHKNQWFRSDVGRDDANLGKEMMLNSDLCLAFTMNGRAAEELDAGRSLRPDERECCAWRFASNEVVRPPKTNYHIEGEEFCGRTDLPTDSRSFLEVKEACCGDRSVRDCPDTFELRGPAYDAVKAFALSEEEWLRTFVEAWKLATENGASDLKPLVAAA